MKHCKQCGCILEDNHIGSICECCIDDMHDSDYLDVLERGRKINRRIRRVRDC